MQVPLMTKFSLPIWMIAAHFVFDWLLQSDRMALGKSKSNSILSEHAFVATVWALPVGYPFWLANFIAHWITDYLTSRMTSKLWFIDNLGLAKEFSWFNKTQP